ncbi:MAG: hypothetical protein QM723_05075 [Myxococcaceae bacterium]
MRTQQLYPSIVPAGYGSAFTHLLAKLPLVDGLEVVLCEASTEIAGYVRTEDLEAASLSPKEAHRLALGNLIQAALQGELPMTLGQPDDEVTLFIVSGWLAASALLLPALRETAQRALGVQGELCAMIPHREMLVLFEGGDSQRRARVQNLVAETEKHGCRPLTNRVLRVLPTRADHWYAAGSPVEYLNAA